MGLKGALEEEAVGWSTLKTIWARSEHAGPIKSPPFRAD